MRLDEGNFRRAQAVPAIKLFVDNGRADDSCGFERARHEVIANGLVGRVRSLFVARAPIGDSAGVVVEK